MQHQEKVLIVWWKNYLLKYTLWIYLISEPKYAKNFYLTFNLLYMETIFLLFNLISTLLIAGILWFVQLVHYPLFNEIPAKNMVNYGYYHMQKISGIINLLFIVDFITIVFLLLLVNSDLSATLMVINISIFLFIVFLTRITFLPIHQQLSKNPNSTLIAKLINLNWIRTLVWSLKVIFLLIIFIEILI